MRYRDYKIFRQDQYYHIFNRGNNRQKIFLDDQDYQKLLRSLKITLNKLELRGFPSAMKKENRIKPFPKDAFSIIAYCLMPNHYHFLIRQNANIPITKLILKVFTSYSSYFNKKHERVGHLFQGNFKAKLVENDVYLKYLSAYIHNNPKNPENYKYSSLYEYSTQNPSISDQNHILKLFPNTESYRSFVKQFKIQEHPDLDDITY